MILLASSTASAMVISSLMSIFILGETFICKYDLTAMVFISVGCALMILQTHIQIVELDYDSVKELLISNKSIGICVIASCIFTVTVIAYLS